MRNIVFITTDTMGRGMCSAYVDRPCVETPNLERLAQWLEQHHPYDLPEVIARPVMGGSPGYLDWVAQETET